MEFMWTWAFVFGIFFMIPELEAFIPRECQMELPRYCKCRFPDRPLVSCRGSYRHVPKFPKPSSPDGLNIHTLDLSDNSIVEIGSDICEYCVGIKRLDLSHNRISWVQRDEFVKPQWRHSLEYLDLSYNLMSGGTMMGLENLENLKTLKLDHNQLRTIESYMVPRMDNLEMLTLNDNKLRSFTLTKLHSKVFHLSVYTFSPISLPSGIEELVITWSPHILAHPVNVNSSTFKYVALESSDLTAALIVKSAFFEDTPKLKHLSLNSNKFTSSDPENFSRLMTQVKNIEHLDLSINYISEVTADIFQPLSKLKHLNISDNRITKIDWRFLESLPDLEILDLSKNKIATSVGMKDSILKLTKLKSFSIGDNPFKCACNDLRELHDLINMTFQPPHLIGYSQIMLSARCATPDGNINENVLNYFAKNCHDFEDESKTWGSAELRVQKITNTTS